MLLVFQVNNGRMIELDMSVALGTVEALKKTMEKDYNIPCDKQVLLISGGELLDDQRKVCSYTGGTDTNPIFLFNKAAVETPLPPSIDCGDDSECQKLFSSLNATLKKCKNLPASARIAIRRVKLTRMFRDLAKKETIEYRKLIHEQQGCSTIRANFEDSNDEKDYQKLLFDLNTRLTECMNLPDTFDTVARRAKLAQEFHDLAKEQTIECEKLVHDQHIQQQGWCAVLANFEDTVTEIKKRSDKCLQKFNDYMSQRDTYLTYLAQFKEDLNTLEKIPLLSPLYEIYKQNYDKEDSEPSENAESSKEISVLQWLTDTDNVNLIYDNCSFGMQKLDGQAVKLLQKDIRGILVQCTEENKNMREIGGLGARLSGLDTLLREAKVHVQQQADLAQSFLKNKDRVSNLKDQSILPDLCSSHKNQLGIMDRTHQQLCDIKRRCLNAKQELSHQLHFRLRWVMYLDDKIAELDQSLVIHHENLRRLEKNLKILQQLHVTPTTYLRAVAEVVRRKMFSQAFLTGGTGLACRLLAIHNEEVARRKEFQTQFQGHFLGCLFPGLEDIPPSFAVEAPAPFDSSLPEVTMIDVERLRKEIPELADSLHIPDLSAVTNLFKLLEKNEEEKLEEETKAVEDKLTEAVEEKLEQAVEEKLVEAVSEVELGSKLDDNLLKGVVSESCLPAAHGLPHLKDLDRGCESETDTEEFEKVGQSPLELNFDKQIPSPRLGTQDATTSKEGNLEISRGEYDRMKSYILKMGSFGKATISELKSDLEKMRTDVEMKQTEVLQFYEGLGSSWENVILEKDNKERELVESIKKDHELKVNDLKKIEKEKNEQIENLLMEKSTLELQVLQSCENLQELQENMNQVTKENEKKVEELLKQLHEKELEKDKNIKEITDRLNREHRAEMENIRSRFKLMTMERSPSETNLEKSGDFSSLSSTTSTLLMQITENAELDKERAVNKALKEEKEKWEALLADKVKEMETKFEEEKEILIQEIARKISEEKEKQIDVLRERERNLNLECIKYKSTIQQLAEYGTESHDSEMLERINKLQKEKEGLEEELEKIKIEKVSDLTTSVTVYEGKTDATTSPIKQRDALSKSEITLARTGKLNIESCKVGDQVLVLWDATHESFKILQENKHMYFLHSDFLEVLGLEVVDGKPNKIYCTGEVVDKEYCHARKSENRYKVPKGTKFFRVKVKPLALPSTSKDVTQSLYHPKSTVVDSSNMSLSHSTISTISTITEVIPEDNTSPHTPTSSPTREHPAILERFDEKEEALPTNPLASRPESVERTIDEDCDEQASALLDSAISTENRDESEIQRFQKTVLII